MMSKRGSAIIVLIALAFLASYYFQQHFANSESAAFESRERIVVLSPSSCELLYALGLGEEVVGVSRFTTFPSDAVSKPKIGGYLDVDLEALIRLKPDVAVLLDQQKDLANQLEKKGIQTVLLNNLSVENIKDNYQILGEYFGAEVKAIQLLEETEKRIKDVFSKTRDLEKQKVLIVIGRERGEGKVLSLTAAGAAGYHQELLGLANASNGYRGAEAFPQLSLEHLLTMNPDVIIDMVNTKEAESIGVEVILEDWQAHTELKAVRENRVYVLAGDKHFVPGPRFVDTLEWIAEHLMD